MTSCNLNRVHWNWSQPRRTGLCAGVKRPGDSSDTVIGVSGVWHRCRPLWWSGYSDRSSVCVCVSTIPSNDFHLRPRYLACWSTRPPWHYLGDVEGQCHRHYITLLSFIITSAEEGGYVLSSVCLSVSLFVCLSVGLLANLWMDFDEIFVGVGHGSRTKWYNFGGDPDHASDSGVQSPKSGFSGLPCSAEVCALWVLLVSTCFRIPLWMWLA